MSQKLTVAMEKRNKVLFGKNWREERNDRSVALLLGFELIKFYEKERQLD